MISRFHDGTVRRRGLATTVAALCAAALVLAGCSGTGSSPAAGSGGSASAGAKPVNGGTLTVVTPSLASTDPQGALAQDTGTSTIAKAIFSRLVVPDGSNFDPELATKWTHSADGLSWTFTLDPKAKFSDGTPVTADDVKASLARVVALKGVNASLFSAVTTVTAQDPHTLVIDTKTPVGTLLYSLSLLYIAPAGGINQADFWTKPIGSGPFELSSFAVGDRAVLVRNPNYWGTPAHLDKVVLEVVPEVSGQVAALQTGEVDVVTNLPQDQIASVQGAGGAQIDESNSLAILSIWFNNAQKPFTDARVRQAMWYAVDWNSIRTNLYGQTANVGKAPIGSGVFGFSAQNPYPFDPAKAKSLLAAAGYAAGFSTTIKYVPTAVPGLESALEAAAGDWAAVGVKVTLVPQESAVWTSDLIGLNWSMTALLNTSRTADADQILGRLYQSSAKRLGFSDPQYDALVQDAAASFDQTTRAADYAKAIQILWTQAVGIWPLELKATYAVANRVHGFVPDPSNVPDFSSVYVTGS